MTAPPMVVRWTDVPLDVLLHPATQGIGTLKRPELELVSNLRDSHHVTITHIVCEYVVGRVRRGEITASTGLRTQSILLAFAACYGQRIIANMSRHDIERWLETRSHVSPATRRHEFSTVRYFVRQQVEAGRIRRDPTQGMRAPTVPRSAGRALSADEADRLEAVLPDTRARAIFALMRWMGLRRCEVLNLQVADWDRRGETLHVRGKGGHERIEPVPAWVAAPLSAYLAESRTVNGPLIRTHDGLRGISNSYLGRMMSDWMCEAGVKVAAFDGRACHSLRHTIASELIESGADVRVVQDLLGHQSITSTQVYLRRAGTARIREALETAKRVA